MFNIQRLRIVSQSRSKCYVSLYPPQRRWASSSNNHHYKVAIVGSGPSGCYTAKYLQAAAAARGGTTTTIDMLERLPTPFGLVRSGVAPDHPEVKNVQNDFTALFEENTNNEGYKSKNKSSISFYGNVTVGTDVSLHELRQLYDVVVLAYGCESERKLGIPGEDALSSTSSHHHGGVLSAREFVAWYNGHPDFGHIGAVVETALSRSNPQQESHAVVIGHGNVALDCARILAKGRPGLIDTDISDHALSVIGDGVHSTTIVGRRGHIQGAFTIKEVRELTKLNDASFLVLEDELDGGTTNASLQELDGLIGRPKKRIDKLLRQAAASSTASATESKAKQVALRFLLNPVRFEASKEDPSILGAVVCERTKLEGEASQQQAVGTGEFVHLPAQLALVSVGYKGVSMPGLEDWFDERRGVVINTNGKVADSNDILGGLYVSGWLKRGPSGIIGTNIADAKDTVASIVKDLETRDGTETTSLAAKSSSSLTNLLTERHVKIVDWEAYQRINAVETANLDRKRSAEQPRAKIPTREELLETAFQR